MRIRAAIIVGFVFSSVAIGGSAYAATLPSGVFQMRDGSYFHPASGFVTSNLDAMLAHVSSTPPLASGGATSTPELPPPTLVSFPLKLAIQRAQELLSATTTPLHVENSDTDFRDVSLALWDPKTDAIRIVDVKKKGTELQRVTPGAPKIAVIRSNGVNSEFSVATGENVVAIRYPIYADRKISKTKTVYDVTDAIYTPYSRAIHTPEMVEAGKRWFEKTVSGLFDDLRAKGVPSRAFPDKLLADVIDENFVKSIAIIEHLDNSAFLKDPRRQIESFYVTLAANEDDAYDFSKSSAGALGLVQFIPSTYAALVKWPHLHLNPNFESGMRDPVNAIRAQTAYLDYLLSRLPDEATTSYASNRDLSHEFVAAAYNGGATRVAKAMVVWEENLDPNERLHVKTRSRLKLETMKYVLKLRLLTDVQKKHPTLITLATES